MSDTFDLLVIGGGINGAGIARDAAGRGLDVCLVEKDDLAAHTSSASTKLVHGGLRYLEHYEFRLVRESLIERERLLRIAPHIIWPMRFVLPHDDGLRPSWLLRLGLFLYDHIGGRKLLPPTRTVSLREPPHAEVLEERLVKGFEYSDCWVEDSRLVVLNCLDAKERGAEIRTRTECIGLERRGQVWIATLKSGDGEHRVVARQVVNAAGPWVDGVLGRAVPGKAHENLRLVKGSHLIFPRLFDHEYAYIFQNRDNRIVFAIPYEHDFTLVGTTDVGFEGDPSGIEISGAEAQYICDAVNEYLRVDVTPDQAVSSYAGVRPLYDDKSAANSTVTRDYVFEVDRGEDGKAPPILSIFGGKITTYRKLAVHALEKLGYSGSSWTADEVLPGGDLGECEDGEEFAPNFAWAYERWSPPAIFRMARAYGSRITAIIGTFDAPADPGSEVAPGLFEAELRYLVEHEFARSAEDVLWRRSKLALHLDEDARQRVADWFVKEQIA